MAKTRFRTGERKDIFLYSTSVENLFINEFLPDAPGDFVKVFLLGLMYAEYEEDIDSKTMAHTLGLSEKDVDNAWKYWETQGLVRIFDGFDEGERRIEFIRQIDQFYGKSVRDIKPEDGADAVIERVTNQQLKEIYDKYQELTGRTMSRREASKLEDAVKLYSIEPDILNFAIDYCTDIDKYSVDYIFKVALRWKEEGCKDVAEVKVMLDKHSRRNEFYRQVFGAMGWTRLPAPAEREIMDKWLDNMGYSIKEVLDACRAAAGIREPSLRYVNKVLENKILEKGGVAVNASPAKTPAAQAYGQTQDQAANTEVPKAMVSRKVLKDYFDYLRQEEEKDRASRTEEARLRIPGMKDILSAEASLNTRVAGLDPGPGARERRLELRNKRRALQDEKKALLSRNGYPEDYLDKRYKCDICKDTGYTDEGRTCTCCRQRAEEAYKWIQTKK